MKKIILGLAAATLTFAMSVAASAVFAKVNDYSKTTFTDVKDTAWYAGEIKSAYELGFMNGTSDTLMSPDGTVTVAQAVTIASRANAVYNGRSAELEKSTGTKWYDVYLDYAQKYGIINKEDYNSFDRAARRYEVAVMFKNALPESHYAKKNNVTSIPDVYPEDEFYNDVLALYNAGVVMGSDDYGTFYPNNSIKRSEIAAIINRAALPESRKSGTLKEYTLDRMDQAVYLIEDYSALTHNRKNDGGTEINHQWNVDNRNASGINKLESYTPNLVDESSESLVALRRYITPVTDQHVVLETTISLGEAGDGFMVYLSRTDKTPVVGFYSENGYWGVIGKQNVLSKIAYANGQSVFKLDMDLAGKKAVLYVNGVFAAETTIGDFDQLNEISYSSTDEAKLTFGFINCFLYMNYVVNDTFHWEAKGAKPAGYEITGNVSNVGKTSGSPDLISVKMTDASSAKKKFEAMKDGFVVEAYVLRTGSNNKATFEFTNGDKSIVKVEMANGVYTVDGKQIWQYHDEIWQCIRLQKYSDGRAVLRICGKDAYEFKYDGAVDGIAITNAGGTLMFDDVVAYNTYDFVDYVSQPVAVNKMDDYTICMSVCSLWREGTHYGWDFVAAYDELMPIMGFYDEGLAETADWEIKYMVEHGVDAIQPCWYASTQSPDTPMKFPKLNKYAIHDGYFNAKYKDMMDICIMWENQSFSTTLNVEKFKTLLWNYWVDWYFTDPNYMCFDNKPVLTIYRMDVFLSCFENGAQAMEVLDFMRKDIKNYGYDDIIILFNCYTNHADYDKTAKDAGLKFDGLLPYHWGVDAYAPKFIKDQYINGYYGKGDNMIVACASTGRNIIGWEQTRTPIATHEQHVEVLEYLKNDVLKKYEQDFGKGSWQSKMVFLGTWNEYAEGHWLAPTGRNGNGPYFDYPSAWAKVFAGVDTSVYDIVPTAGQKARIAYMYPAVETPIRAWLLEEVGSSDNKEEVVEIPTNVVAKIDFTSEADKATFSYTRTDSTSFENGILKVVAETPDTKGDSIIRTSKFKGIETSKVDAIHIRMKGTEASKINIYPTFDYDLAYTAAKCVKSTYTTANEWADIYIDMRECPYWTGKIENIRFNLFNTAYGTYECDTIELMTYGKTSAAESEGAAFGYYVDGIKLDINDSYIVDDGEEFYLAALPTQGFYACTNIYYEWHRFEGDGKLYLKAGNGNKAVDVVFTVGKKTALVNGVEKQLKKEFYLYDAIPVLPVKFLFANIGVEYTYDKTNGIKANIRGIDFGAAKASRKSHAYDFNVAGDTENWKLGKSTGYVVNGALNVVAVEQASGAAYDPMISCETMRPEVLVATNCDTITVRMKAELEGVALDDSKARAQIFFRTSKDSAFAANRGVYSCKFSDAPVDEDGWMTLEFDMASNELWAGSIIALRFDPFNCAGTAKVDYIKCNLKDTGIDEGTIYEEPKENAVLEYNFDEDIDTKIFGITRANTSVSDGNLVVEATPKDDGKYDPIVAIKKEFDASEVKKINVRVKLVNVPTSEVAQIYFATPDSNYTADRCLTVKYTDLKPDAEGYYLVSFDVTNLNGWAGTIKSVRFDFYNCAGTVEVDYIKFYGASGATTVTPAAPATPAVSVDKLAIVNGNAEDTSNSEAFHSMYSPNTISIVEDPRNSKNHVWKVTPGKEGKIYVSLFHNVTFEAGKKYKVEFDVCVLSDYTGVEVAKTNVFVNAYYNDDKKNHTKSVSTVPSGEWKHVSVDVTIEDTTSDRSKDAIGVFASPVNDMGMILLMDNFTITEA